MGIHHQKNEALNTMAFCEQELLNELEKSCRENFGEEDFAYDGIMFRGAFVEHPEYNNIERLPSGDEWRRWESAPLRIAFITKDQNSGGEGAWDVRSETGITFRNQTQPYGAFFKNLMYTLYGLVNTTAAKRADFEFNDEDAIRLYNEFALARVNVKKPAGSGSLPDTRLAFYLDRDRAFIKRQILGLDPDILVCCGYSQNRAGTGNRILDFVIGNYYEAVEVPDSGGWLYHDVRLNKLCVNTWHPSYKKGYASMQKAYEELTGAYQRFLLTHPNFSSLKSTTEYVHQQE